jgi:hypothetical protein
LNVAAELADVKRRNEVNEIRSLLRLIARIGSQIDRLRSYLRRRKRRNEHPKRARIADEGSGIAAVEVLKAAARR